MKNKKSLILAISFGILFIILTIVGNMFCNWALYLLPIAFAPITIWAVRNSKNLFEHFNSKTNANK